MIKVKLDRFRQFESNEVIQTVDLEFTFESNRLEGNTLSPAGKQIKLLTKD
jgi:hypothetical protein